MAPRPARRGRTGPGWGWAWGLLARRSLGLGIALAWGLGGGLGLPRPAYSETLLETRDRIVPAERTYTFEGTAGQAITIELTSIDFDPVVSLLNSAGNEIAFNDDFGISFNATIIVALPTTDTYTVVARSYSGNGGNFDLVVRTATAYEIAYARAQQFTQAEAYREAIAAYTEAIALDDQQAAAYLGRAEASLGLAYLAEEALSGPEDIPPALRQAIIDDFETAAALIDVTGPQDWANELRQQADFLRNVGTPTP